MAELVTKEFRIHNAEQFREQFSEAVPDNVYLFIGRPEPWTDDANPPALANNVNEIYYKPYNTMIAMKKVIASDVSLSAPRYNWTPGAIYGAYSATTDFFSSQFYVITDEYKVYKCLSNNNGAASSVKPTSTSTSEVTSVDGYTWKYMFTLNAVDAVKFLTTDYFPVKTLTVDDGSTQWDIQQAAVDGEITTVGVAAGGSGYLYNTNNAQAVGTSAITLHSSASATNSVYNNYSVYILSGPGAGQLRTISAYNGTSRVATISAPWTTLPTTGSVYIVSPGITSSGNGTGFTAYTTVTSGSISAVNVVTKGQNYSVITLNVVGQTGSGATVAGNISPVKGHGANPVSELFAHNVTFNVKMTGTESNLVPIGNDFRVVGLIANPVLAANTNVVANALVYDMTTKLSLDSGSTVGTFIIDETITGSNGTKATIVTVPNSNQVTVTNIVGTFQLDEVITGSVSGATASINVITNPLISKYSGRTLYVKTQTPVYRSNEQSEEYKIVVKF